MPSNPLPQPPQSRRPGRPRQDEAAAAEVRERLLDAATQLTIEQGFDNCGLREIAARAEVSPGMIAYYFGDRRGLYDAMLTRAIDRVGERVRGFLEQEGSFEKDGIEGLVRMQIAGMASDPWLPRLLLREILTATDPTARARLVELIGDKPIGQMIEWLDASKARGSLRGDLDTKLTALTLGSLAAFPFLILPTLGERIGVSIDDAFPGRLIEHNLKLLTQGIRARPEDES